MRMNTKIEGSRAIFQEWQTILLEELFRRQETYPEELRLRKMSSRDGYEHLKELGIRTAKSRSPGTVSRATVINFLNDFVDAGMITFTEETGKGGHRRLYEMLLTRAQFDKRVIAEFVGKLAEIYPEESEHLKKAVDAVIWKELIA